MKNIIPENYSPNFEENRKAYHQHASRTDKTTATSKKQNSAAAKPGPKRNLKKPGDRT